MTIQGQAEGSRRPHRPQTAVGGADVAGPADSQDMTGVWFPRLAVRDLDGCEVALPAGLPGEWTVVIVAFRREQQDLVDSWVPWLEQPAAADSRLGFVELPAIGLRWQPARPVIDGGMAAAIPDQKTRRRTLTVYTDIRRITVPLGITDRNTIWLFLVDRAGRVRWRGSGGRDAATAAALTAALANLPGLPAAAPPAAGPGAGQFEMAFASRFRLTLAALGVTSATGHVTLTPDRLVACFGPWVCRTAPSNVRAVSLTRPYHWYRAIGPRLSLADHGLTFGTTTTGGVCLQLRDPVPGIDPIGPDPPPEPDTDGRRPRALRRRHAPLRRDSPGHTGPARRDG
jgi:hypothetical protein